MASHTIIVTTWSGVEGDIFLKIFLEIHISHI
jgi:hypothetical protein